MPRRCFSESPEPVRGHQCALTLAKVAGKIGDVGLKGSIVPTKPTTNPRSGADEIAKSLLDGMGRGSLE